MLELLDELLELLLLLFEAEELLFELLPDDEQAAKPSIPKLSVIVSKIPIARFII